MAFTLNAPDNLIVHGTNFANWWIDATGSTKGAGGVSLWNFGTTEFARMPVTGLVQGQSYWLKLVFSAKGPNAGNFRLMNLGTDGSNFTLPGAVDFNFSATLGTYFVKITAGAPATNNGVPNSWLIAFRNASSTVDGVNSHLDFSDCVLYPIPARSSAKVALLGDRTANYSSVTAGQVDSAILLSAADNVNVVSPGDMSDGSNAIAATNDSLRNSLIAKGGNIFATPGNWDYTASIATWKSYFGLSNTYRSVVLGDMEFFFYDNNTDNPDNNQTSVANAQASVMGQWLLNALAASTAKWKIVVMHFPAFSSSTHHGGPSNNGSWPASFSCMAWDWASLGVSLVLQSHDHVVERMAVSGAFYYTFALGGGGANVFGTPIPESQYRSLTPGYLKFYDSPYTLIVEHYDISNNLLDRVATTQTLPVASTRAISYSVRSVVSKARSISFAVRTIAAKTRSVLWNVRTSIGKARAILFNVLVPSKDVRLKFDLTSKVKQTTSGPTTKQKA